jgi:hypothetical protein
MKAAHTTQLARCCVFSALAKFTLLFPLAEFIGQLKWSYLEELNKLHHLQAFDEVSRGP